MGLKTVLCSAVDMIFPQTCGVCGGVLQERGMPLCWDCRAQLRIITPPFCARCGEPVHGVIDHDYVCHACMRHPPTYQRSRAALHYNDTGKQLVIQFKYRHALWLEDFLAGFLVAAVAAHYVGTVFDAVAAVPLHAVKRRERGFNQSLLLTKALARQLGLPVVGARSLRRIRPTPSQTRLTAGQRLTNVRGAFDTTNPDDWAGKRILLVDDVMTTGATVGACARVLSEAGAESVDVITVARGI